jgi:NADH-quinone oxidoreductase subunit N
MENINFIFTEIFISLSIMLLLIFGVFKKNSSNLVYSFSILILLISLGLVINSPTNQEIYLFDGSYKIDLLSNFMKTVAIISGIFVLLSSYKYIKLENIFKIEYPVLILCSILGMLVMISSYDLMVFYMGLELQSLSLYVLAAFNINKTQSSEAGLKYFVLSALSSGLLLYGCSLIYGFSGTTNFDLISQNILFSDYGNVFGIVFILTGLAFKISAVPFHVWAPDVYEGSPTSISLFFAVVPKIAALTVFIRFLYVPFIGLFDQWQIIIIFLSLSSMIFGAIAAIGQKNLKRLIAYSSIGHMGYALAGLAVGTNSGIQSSIIYICIYVIMNLGIFSCLFMLKRDNKFFDNLEDLSGLSKNHPILSLCFLILLFSLAGIPPLAGFFAKFYIFVSVVEQSMYFLAIVGLISTVVSAFYYLKIIKIIYFDNPKEKYDKEDYIGSKISLAISTIIVLLYFIYPNWLTALVSRINFI